MKVRNQRLRFIVDPAAGGGSAESAPATPAPTPADVAAKTTATEREKSADKADESTPAPSAEEPDSEGRGSKREVLADLARERDKRQALQEELTALKETRAGGVAELQAQLAEQKKLIDGLLAEKAEVARKADIEAALTAAKLPAEMAARLKGDTREELEADAKALAEVLGFDRKPVDPAQGKGSATPEARTLEAALRAHYDK